MEAVCRDEKRVHYLDYSGIWMCSPWVDQKVGEAGEMGKRYKGITSTSYTELGHVLLVFACLPL